MKKLQNGFTLLEMLIVLGIIALIVTIAAVSYSTAQKKTRDSRKKSDLKYVQSAMEQYYSVCGFQYPVAVGGNGGLVPTIVCLDPSTAIMPTQALDPRTTTPYIMPTSDATQYQICATMETETNNYCVTNQQ